MPAPRLLRTRTLAALLGLLGGLASSPPAVTAANKVEAAAPTPPRASHEGLKGVDLTGLSSEQQELALRILNESGCLCGCGMTVAQCRVEDQSCPRSPLLARAIVDAVRRGGDQAAVRTAYHQAAGLAEPAPPGGTSNPKGLATRGAANAPVTLVEYSDFECGHCRAAQAVVKELLAESGASVRLVFRHYPLPSHANARPAALAAEAAKQQGKFWEMHDLLFAEPMRLDAGSLREYARTLGLDMARFERAMASEETAAAVDRDVAEGKRNSIPGTPSFFVNGKRAASYEIGTLRSAIDEALRAATPAK